MSSKIITLKPGRKYDTDTLEFAHWSTSDGEYPGCNCWDYFDQDGTYRGPDQDGVDPLFFAEAE